MLVFYHTLFQSLTIELNRKRLLGRRWPAVKGRFHCFRVWTRFLQINLLCCQPTQRVVRSSGGLVPSRLQINRPSGETGWTHRKSQMFFDNLKLYFEKLNKGFVFWQSPSGRKMIGLMTRWRPIRRVYRTTSQIKTNVRKSRRESVWIRRLIDLSAFNGETPSAALPLVDPMEVGGRRWRGSEAGSRGNEALLQNLRFRDTDVVFTLDSVVLMCLCSWSHFSHIYYNNTSCCFCDVIVRLRLDLTSVHEPQIGKKKKNDLFRMKATFRRFLNLIGNKL